MVSIIAGLIIPIAALAAHYFVAQEFYKAAVMKGWPQKKYFLMAFFLWIIGYMLIMALPDRGGNFRTAVISDDLPDI